MTEGGMKSNRVLLSDKHSHNIKLTEQDLGITLHALRVLMHAFSEEGEYLDLIMAVDTKVREVLA